MPTLTRRLTVLVALLAVGLPLGLAAARQQDPLSEAKQRQAVADQQSQKQADEAIDQANELAKRGRSAEALKVIQDALDRVKNNPDLSDAKRDKLTRSLGYWRRQFDSEAKDPVTNPGTGTGKRPPPPTDPDRKGAYEQATKTLAVRGVNVIDASNLQDERVRRYLGAMKGIDEALLPPIGEYTFPPNWADLSKRHEKSGNTLTQRERELLRELNYSRELEFQGEKLQDVIKYLEKVSGQPINADPEALREANVTYEGSVVNYPRRKAALRYTLKKVLGDLGLTYVVKDESILITTPARAREMMTTRTYYVGDLIAVDPRQGPLAMTQQVNQLLVLIQQTIDPESWEYRGGPGSIYFDPASMTFVVKQSAEVHYRMGIGLRR